MSRSWNIARKLDFQRGHYSNSQPNYPKGNVRTHTWVGTKVIISTKSFDEKHFIFIIITIFLLSIYLYIYIHIYIYIFRIITNFFSRWALHLVSCHIKTIIRRKPNLKENFWNIYKGFKELKNKDMNRIISMLPCHANFNPFL